MLLKLKIKQDLNSFIKERKELETTTLRMLNAAILNKEKEKRARLAKENLEEKELVEKSQLNEEEIIEVISSEAKKRKEAIAGFEQGGRIESAEKEKKELGILQKYLPEQMSEEEIKKLAQEAIAKIGASEARDTGKVMAELMPKVKGKADGGLVSKIVKELLEN